MGFPFWLPGILCICLKRDIMISADTIRGLKQSLLTIRIPVVSAISSITEVSEVSAISSIAIVSEVSEISSIAVVS